MSHPNQKPFNKIKEIIKCEPHEDYENDCNPFSSELNNDIRELLTYSNNYFVKSNIQQVYTDNLNGKTENQDNGLTKNFQNINIVDTGIPKYDYTMIKTNMNDIEFDRRKSNLDSFKKNLTNLRAYSDNYLEIFKNNFISYIDNQKKHLSNYLSTIDDLMEVEAKSSEAEEAKRQMIEKKVTEYTKEFNIIVNDLNKLKN